MAALAAALGPAQSRAWLKDLSLAKEDGEWVLLASTRFIASWVATQFDQALRRAAATAEMQRPPKVRVRPDRAVIERHEVDFMDVATSTADDRGSLRTVSQRPRIRCAHVAHRMEAGRGRPRGFP